jgi:hypothetical protein
MKEIVKDLLFGQPPATLQVFWCEHVLKTLRKHEKGKIQGGSEIVFLDWNQGHSLMKKRKLFQSCTLR